METSSRAYNAEYLTFYNKNSLLIDRLRFVRESYKDIFTELLLADDTRVGFHRQDNGLLVWQGAYLTRSAETLLSWRAVANALNDLIEQHELIAAIDPKELPQAEEQLSFELPDGSQTSAEDDRLEKDDFLTPEKQETVIRSALPVAEYNAPQMDDGSVITDEEINLALAAGSNFENSKFRIYQQFTTTQGGVHRCSAPTMAHSSSPPSWAGLSMRMRTPLFSPGPTSMIWHSHILRRASRSRGVSAGTTLEKMTAVICCGSAPYSASMFTILYRSSSLLSAVSANSRDENTSLPSGVYPPNVILELPIFNARIMTGPRFKYVVSILL